MATASSLPRGQLRCLRHHGEGHRESPASVAVPRREASRRASTVPRASGASFSGDSYSGGGREFPRINVRDPYKRLGLPRDASTEEVTEAKNYLLAQYAGHKRSCDAIEEAFDKIIYQSFKDRSRPKLNIGAGLKKFSTAPPWAQKVLGRFETPARPVLLQRTALFVALAAWGLLNPSEGGPALQVALAFFATVYFINQRLQSFWKSPLVGFGTLLLGIILSTFIVPFIPNLNVLGGFWSLEIGTGLISLGLLWFVATFLR